MCWWPVCRLGQLVEMPKLAHHPADFGVFGKLHMPILVTVLAGILNLGGWVWMEVLRWWQNSVCGSGKSCKVNVHTTLKYTHNIHKHSNTLTYTHIHSHTLKDTQIHSNTIITLTFTHIHSWQSQKFLTVT